MVDPGQEAHRRVWRNFAPERFRLKIRAIDWIGLFNYEDINLINDIFEEEKSW